MDIFNVKYYIRSFWNHGKKSSTSIEQILWHLESNRQFGFSRIGLQTYILAYATDIWNKVFDVNKDTFAIVIEISKAFGLVWHTNFLTKVPVFGLTLSLCMWRECFLSNRSIKDVVDGISSFSFYNNAVVLQGSAITPTLFLIYIMDLLNLLWRLRSYPIHCYTDDSKVVKNTH